MTFNTRKQMLQTIIDLAPEGPAKEKAKVEIQTATCEADLIRIAMGMVEKTEAEIVKMEGTLSPEEIARAKKQAEAAIADGERQLERLEKAAPEEAETTVKKIPVAQTGTMPKDLMDLFPLLKEEVKLEPGLQSLVDTMQQEGSSSLLHLAKQLIVGLNTMAPVPTDPEQAKFKGTVVIMQAAAALAAANFLVNLAVKLSPAMTPSGNGTGAQLVAEIIGLLGTKTGVALDGEAANIVAKAKAGVKKGEIDPDLAAAIFGSGGRPPASC